MNILCILVNTGETNNETRICTENGTKYCSTSKRNSTKGGPIERGHLQQIAAFVEQHKSVHYIKIQPHPWKPYIYLQRKYRKPNKLMYHMQPPPPSETCINVTHFAFYINYTQYSHRPLTFWCACKKWPFPIQKETKRSNHLNQSDARINSSFSVKSHWNNEFYRNANENIYCLKFIMEIFIKLKKNGNFKFF